MCISCGKGCGMPVDKIVQNPVRADSAKFNFLASEMFLFSYCEKCLKNKFLFLKKDVFDDEKWMKKRRIFTENRSAKRHLVRVGRATPQSFRGLATMRN